MSSPTSAQESDVRFSLQVVVDSASVQRFASHSRKKGRKGMKKTAAELRDSNAGAP